MVYSKRGLIYSVLSLYCGYDKGVTFLQHVLSGSPITTHWDSTQSTLRVSKVRVSSKQEVNSEFETVWEERVCNNVKYVKNNVLLEQSSMKPILVHPKKYIKIL